MNGRHVVVTGRIAGETRTSAEAKLRAAGALVQKAVTRDTEVLVTGEAVGATKITKAQQLGVEIVPWENVWNGNGNGAAVAAPAAPPSPRKRGIVAHALAPMLAKKGDGLPAGGWLFEVKWDGYRCVARIAEGEVTLTSRSGQSYTFPQIEAALAAVADLPQQSCVLDGEVVVLDEQGRSNFAALGNGHTGAVYVVFDVVEVNGESVRGFPLEARKAALRDLLAYADDAVVSESPTFEDGEALLVHAGRLGLEGIIAKRCGSTYQDGKRSADWLKIKLRCEQEFVVAGWTPGEGARGGRIGALILAVHDDDGDLVYAGRCGTGFTDAELDRLGDVLAKAERGTHLRHCPLVTLPEKRECRDAVWCEPSVVVQAEFQRWTDDGKLFHPSYKGQRHDKDAGDVRREP